MSLFGKPNIEKMAARFDVKGLVKTLAYKDPQVRKDAARALGDLAEYLDIPPVDLSERSKVWPMKWPGIFYQNIKSGDWMGYPLRDNEIMIGHPLQVKLIFMNVEQPGVEIQNIPGTRERSIFHGMRLRSPTMMGSHHPAWNVLGFMLTDSRVVVQALNWGMMAEHYWSCSIADLHKLSIDNSGDVVLDFGDEDPLTFNVDGSGIVLTMIKKEELPDWVEKANLYINLFHDKKTDLNLYLAYIKAERRSGYLALEKLIACLKDPDADVRSEVINSLQKIGCPMAQKALLQVKQTS